MPRQPHSEPDAGGDAGFRSVKRFRCGIVIDDDRSFHENRDRRRRRLLSGRVVRAESRGEQQQDARRFHATQYRTARNYG